MPQDLHPDTADRFARIRLLIGPDKLERLRCSHVTVVGLGAVGAQAVEALARAGVGALRLIDFDIIRPSNINRHIWAFQNTIGQPKALTARDRLYQIDPDIKVDALQDFLAEDTFERLIDQKTDLVIDAIDSLNPKIQLLAGCHKRQIPVISSMGAATRTDPSKIRVNDLFETKVCPLAARIRRRLKEQGVKKGITCVYSEEPSDVGAMSGDMVKDAGEYQRGRYRRTLGSLPTIPGIFGLILANTAITIICGKEIDG